MLAKGCSGREGVWESPGMAYWIANVVSGGTYFHVHRILVFNILCQESLFRCLFVLGTPGPAC